MHLHALGSIIKSYEVPQQKLTLLFIAGSRKKVELRMSECIWVEDSAKYELDERKGDDATVPFILYANQNHPELKQTHPEWSVRFTKIRKIWSEAPRETRVHYIQLTRTRNLPPILPAPPVPSSNKPSSEKQVYEQWLRANKRNIKSQLHHYQQSLNHFKAELSKCRKATLSYTNHNEKPINQKSLQRQIDDTDKVIKNLQMELYDHTRLWKSHFKGNFLNEYLVLR